MDHSRRELCLLLPAVLAFKGQASSTGVLPSKVYPFESLRVQSSGPNAFRPVFEGSTHEGFRIALHETDLAPGARPHPPHHHPNEEIFLVREGTLVVTIGGHDSTLRSGDVAYVSSGEEHSIRNSGSNPARYFVFELGSDHR